MIEDYYAKDVEAKYQVNPTQFIDLKALMGDTADNIPGVPKVGEKTATELMVQFGSIENIYEHVEEITKKAIRESLIEHRDLADLSKTLATIHVNSEIDYSFEDAKVGNFYTEEAYLLCKQLEFKNLLTRFEKDVTVNNSQTQYFDELTDLAEVEALFEECARIGKQNGGNYEFGLAVLAERSDSEEYLGVAIALNKEKVRFIPCQGLITAKYLSGKISELSEE